MVSDNCKQNILAIFRSESMKTRLSYQDICNISKSIRKRILKMNMEIGSGHTGADLSETDILASLYFEILHYNRSNPSDPDRDRFILSKGHGVGGYYCTLVEAGLLEEKELSTYLGESSRLPGHPVRQKTPFIEVNTGALGHGFSVACGMALAAKKENKEYMTYVLTGDGELQEGSNWEAAMGASQFKLDNLCWIIDRNKFQLADKIVNIVNLEPLKEKIEAFGFNVFDIDGNNVKEIIETLGNLPRNGKPNAVIAHTIKGRGVSFIENQASWHHRTPTRDEYNKAMEELK
jgi:transketolase